jgi:biopolymer transport protein ExbB
MDYWNRTGRGLVCMSVWGLFWWVLASCAGRADDSGRVDRTGSSDRDRAVARPGPAVGHDADASRGDDLGVQAAGQARRLVRWLVAWYVGTPPQERVTWGGLAACAGLGLAVLLERSIRLRRRKIVPAEFTARFLDRLHEGKLDCGQALDHCELNPSPAARVALAAVRRWGRPAADLERAVALSHRVETERLRRNVGTLRRIAVLGPLVGLLGTLLALGHALEAIPLAGTSRLGVAAVEPGPAAPAFAWAPALAAALSPLTTGVLIATLALIAYDGVLTRVEKLAGALDRLGAETIEAIALLAPVVAPPMAMAASPSLSASPTRWYASSSGGGFGTSLPPTRTPHQVPHREEERRDSVSRPRAQEMGF